MSANPEPVELRELSGADIDYDDVFNALSTPRARYLLACLHAKDTQVSLEDIARDVAAWELSCDPSEVSEDAEQRILISLYHTKAPKLAEAGLIEFDPDERTVSVSDAGARLNGLSLLPDIEQAA